MDDLEALFPEASAAARAEARSRFYTVEVGRGATLIEQGERDAAILFIREGRVAVLAGEYEVASVGPGGLVGEVGLFGASVRIATVRAISPCVFVVVDRSDYEQLLDQGNPVAYGIERQALDQAANRLREADARLAGVSEGRAQEPPLAEEARGEALPPGRIDSLEVLRNSSLFADAPIGALDDLAGRMEPRRFNAGEVLCRQGDRGDCAYIIGEGEVEVLFRSDVGKVDQLAVLDAGDAFGMASMIHERSRMATCVARTEVLALRIPRSACHEFAQADDRAGSVLRTAMIRAMSDHIALANAKFAQNSAARKRRTAEMLARLGIDVHAKGFRSNG
jgi:CRP-like cAMP-binding protein